MTKEDIRKTVYDLLSDIFEMEGVNSADHTLGQIMGIMGLALELESIATSEPKDHDGCKDCRFVGISEGEAPCRICKQSYMDQWERRDD